MLAFFCLRLNQHLISEGPDHRLLSAYISSVDWDGVFASCNDLNEMHFTQCCLSVSNCSFLRGA